MSVLSELLKAVSLEPLHEDRTKVSCVIIGTVSFFLLYSLAYLAMLFIAGDTGDGIVFIYKDYRWSVFFGFFRCHRSITHQNNMVAHLNLSGSGTI